MRQAARVRAVPAILVPIGVFILVGLCGCSSDKNDKNSPPTADKKSGAMGDIQSLAAAIEKGDDATVNRLTKEIAGKYDELEKIMQLFRPRKTRGLGVGRKEKAVMPDGIELKLQDMAGEPVKAARLGQEGEALEQMGYDVAAIASVVRAKAPAMDDGPKKVKDWNQWAENLKTAALDLARAAKAKDADGVNNAVPKMRGSCNSCHEKFRKVK
jgi:hypothetical protein